MVPSYTFSSETKNLSYEQRRKIKPEMKGITTEKAACQSQTLGPKYTSITKILFCNTDQTIQIQPCNF